MCISHHMGAVKIGIIFNTIKHTLRALVCMQTLPLRSFPDFLEKGSNKIPHHMTLLFGFTE